MFLHYYKETSALPESRKEISPEVEHTPEVDTNVPTVSHIHEVCIYIKIILKSFICFLKTLSLSWHGSGNHSIDLIFVCDVLGIERSKIWQV